MFFARVSPNLFLGLAKVVALNALIVRGHHHYVSPHFRSRVSSLCIVFFAVLFARVSKPIEEEQLVQSHLL